MNNTTVRELFGEKPIGVEFRYEIDGSGLNERKALKRLVKYMEEHTVTLWSATVGGDPDDEGYGLITAIFHQGWVD